MSHPLSRELCRPRSGQRCTIDGEEYVIGARIGSGAIGLVRKATRRADGRVFAIKFLAPDPKYIEIGAFDDVAARFKREGERGAKLNFSSLIKVVAYGEAPTVSSGTECPTNPRILMEYSGIRWTLSSG